MCGGCLDARCPNPLGDMQVASERDEDDMAQVLEQQQEAVEEGSESGATGEYCLQKENKSTQAAK